MTFSERTKMAESKPKLLTIGKAVREVLVQAFEQQRVHTGVFECAELLECNPDSVMLCILPEEKTQDISIRIQHTLIEAYCRENDIKILKVDSATKISTIFSSSLSKEAKGSERNYRTDFSCILVGVPTHASIEDEFISAYCENFILGGVVPHGTIEIPA